MTIFDQGDFSTGSDHNFIHVTFDIGSKSFFPPQPMHCGWHTDAKSPPLIQETLRLRLENTFENSVVAGIELSFGYLTDIMNETAKSTPRIKPRIARKPPGRKCFSGIEVRNL